jgi:hypothetical protein
MAVFDPRQGQVLISPVTEFYKGKAIRQELANKELQHKKLEFEVENMDEMFQMQKDEAERAKRRVDLLEREVKLREDQFVAEVGEAQARAYAEDLASRLYAVEAAGINGEEAMMGKAYQELSEYAASLPAKHRAKVDKILADGKVTPYEIEALKGGLIASDIVDKDFFGEDGTPKDHRLFAKINPDGTVDWNTVIAARPDSKKAEDAVNELGLSPVTLSAQGPKSETDPNEFKESAMAHYKDENFTNGVIAYVDGEIIKTDPKWWRLDYTWEDLPADVQEDILYTAALLKANGELASIADIADYAFQSHAKLDENGKVVRNRRRTVVVTEEEKLSDGTVLKPGTYVVMPNGEFYSIDRP